VREFSRGNYFSFKRDGHISPQSASHVSRSAISPGILILSYYLISSVTRTDAVPRTPLIGPGTFRPCFFLLHRHQSVLGWCGAAGRMCSIEEPRAKAVSSSLSSSEIFLATENEIRWNRQLIYVGRKLVGLLRTLIESQELIVSTSRKWRLLWSSSRKEKSDQDKRCWKSSL